MTLDNEAGAPPMPVDAPAAMTEQDRLGAALSSGHSVEQEQTFFPPGLLGDTADYYYKIAPRPSKQIALSSAIAFMAGVTGNTYNVFNTGLNQYVLQLAHTGMGKDIASSGSSRLISQIHDFQAGPFPFAAPGELVSAAGMIRWLEDNPCCNVIIGEFPKQLRKATAQRWRHCLKLQA